MKLRYPNSITVYHENGNTVTPTAAGTFADVSVSIADTHAQTLRVSLKAEQTPVCYIRLYWAFSACEKREETVRVYSDVWERGYGDLEWRGIVPERIMPWVCAVSNGTDRYQATEGRRTECFGVKTQPAAMCFWQYDTSGLQLWLDVRCGGNGVILGGRDLTVCDIVFAEYSDTTAFLALRRFYRALCDKPLTPGHKVYGANNWYYAYGRTSETDIQRDTELLTGLCKGNDTAPYMVLDDGWEKNGCDAPWTELKSGKFHNMRTTADNIRALGARPGIWVRPLSDRQYEVFGRDAANRLLRDPEYLDPSHPDTLHFVSETISMLCDWGYELIKHDFTTYDAIGYWGFERKEALAAKGWQFWNRSKTTAEILLNLYRTIYTAAHGRALILGCNTVGHLAAGLVHINRTGDDTSGIDWERVRKYGVNTLAFRLLHHGAFYESDADCVGITDRINWQLNREWLTAVASSGTPLFVSADPTQTGEEEKAALKTAYRINSVQTDTLIPLDWMENTCPEEWLHNGKAIRFNWYPAAGTDTFRP